MLTFLRRPRHSLVADHDQQRPHSRQRRSGGADDGYPAGARIVLTLVPRGGEPMNAKPATPAPVVTSEALLEALFLPVGIDGVYGRSGAYEAVIEGLGAFITRQRDPRAEVMRFPPVTSRALIEKSGYLKS